MKNTWTNPLTGSDTVPSKPGELITAAISYWEDVLMEQRSKRPRKPADRAHKQRTIDTACERLDRYRSERNTIAWTPKKASKTTLALATDDLSAVMRALAERAA